MLTPANCEFPSLKPQSSPLSEGEQLGLDPDPLVIAPDTSLKIVVTKMSQSSTDSTSQSSPRKPKQQHSYALVMTQNKLLGILTERDLVKLTAEYRDFTEITALQVMSTQLITLKASEIKDAFTPLSLMRQHRIRHLPILNDLEEVVGVITSALLREALPASALLKRRMVNEVMATQVITAAPTATIIEVAQLMATHRVSCIVIQESQEHSPQGIITEHDIVQIQRLELDLKILGAETVMSSPLVCMHPEDQLWEVQQKMEQLHVRRLVVVNDQDKLVGLVTQTSILSVLDPQEMTSTIEILQQQVEELQNERVRLLQERNANLETQIQTSETSLIVIQEKFRATFEQAAVGIAHLSLNGQFLAINQRFASYFGYQPTDLLHKCLNDLTHPDDQDTDINIGQLIRGETTSLIQEKRCCRPDGSIFWGNITISLSTQPIGKPDYLITVLEDISSRKQAENALQHLNRELEGRVASSTLALKASEHRYRKLFESAPDMLFVLNLKGEILKANAVAIERLGYTADELIGRSLQHCFMVSSPEIQQRDFERLLHQGMHRKEMQYISRDGTTHLVDCVFSVITDTLDEDAHILVIQRDISTQKLLETKLRSSEQQLRTVFEAMYDLVLICSIQDGEIANIKVAPTAPQSYQQEVKDLAGQTLQFLWDDARIAVKNKIQQVFAIGENVQYEYSLKFEEDELWFMANISPISENKVLWVARNISDLKQAEKALFQEKELAQVTLQSIGDAVITTDTEGKIYNFNPVAENLTGWNASVAKGRPLLEVYKIFDEETREPLENPILRTFREESMVELESSAVLIARDGKEYAIEDSVAPIQNRDGQVVGTVIVFHDVTHSRSLTRQLSWQASHDPLTRLINRRKFDQILGNALQTAQDEGLHHVLCFLDLDQFKIINDTCGHAAGDEVLTKVAELLKKGIRATDQLARFGGDEFAILLNHCPLEKATVIAEDLRQAVQSYQYQWQGKTFSIGVCIGLVAIDHLSSDSESIVRAADSACYAAKAKGRNRIQLYHEDDATFIQKRNEQQWSVRIKQALEQDLFCLYGQPIVPTRENSGKKHFCEILLRMVIDQNEVITAGAFIPAAERYNLILEIDKWVISKFINDYYPRLQTKSEQNQLPAQYMINLSGASVGDKQLLHYLKQLFEKNPDVAQHICFEITETSVISNLSQAIQFMEELKKLGCSFALDDFGAGMSSFAYLKSLPVDYLKIDGRFIEDLINDPATCAIVESINHIGHVMGIQTIAEFVSNTAIRNKLNDISVNYVQGFDIAMPEPLAV